MPSASTMHPQRKTDLFLPPASPGASSPQRRRFVRDGEVPVSVIRRDQDDGANTNKLDATRQALREQIEAREQRGTPAPGGSGDDPRPPDQIGP